MASRDVVDTIHGRHSKYEIVRSPAILFGNPTYAIYKDGKYWKGSYDSRARAVEVARAEG